MIPTIDEWIENLNEPLWLNNGVPNSFNNIEKTKIKKLIIEF
jgi:hypothetical protein